jgi:hypothetical protein
MICTGRLNSTGLLPRRSARASAARWGICPWDASPTPTTMRDATPPNAATSGTWPMVVGSRCARKNSELACIRTIPSSISGLICDMSGICGACSWLDD